MSNQQNQPNNGGQRPVQQPVQAVQPSVRLNDGQSASPTLATPVQPTPAPVVAPVRMLSLHATRTLTPPPRVGNYKVGDVYGHFRAGVVYSLPEPVALALVEGKNGIIVDSASPLVPAQPTIAEARTDPSKMH